MSDEKPGGSWWPYGPLADALADAVLSGDQEKIAHYVERVKDERRKAVEFGKIESEFYEAMENMRWEQARILIEKMRKIGGLTQHAVVRHESMWFFEKDDTVLDRLGGLGAE